MAVAGLHNVSAFGPFFCETQSSVSGHWDNERNRPSRRASSILRMWRELEGDHMMSPSRRSRQQRNPSNHQCDSIGQECDNTCAISHTENHVVTSSEMEHDDNHSVISEQSSDLGENERERVRQIFLEWKNSGASNRSPSNEFDLNNRSGPPQVLGENECERVRLIREWVQMSADNKSNSDPRSPRSDVTEIEQVREGLISNHSEIGVRRPIRKLCGRQTLIDLLLRAQCERKGELQHLSEQRPVSEFAHRNRIQALLRGRFLRNERLIPEKRQSSVAETELDFLRQRQTVSDLREEFLSKLDNSASTSNNAESDDSSSSQQKNSELESVCPENKVTQIDTTWNSDTVEGNRSRHDPVLRVTQTEGNEQEVPFPQSIDHQVTDLEDHSLHVEEIECEVSLRNDQVDQHVSIDGESTTSGEEQILDIEASNQDVPNDIEHSDGGSNGDHVDGVTITNESSFQINNNLELYDVHSNDLEESTTQEFVHRDVSSQLGVFQESESTDHNTEEDDEEDLPRIWDETLANQWFQETSETTSAALDHDDRVQETPHEDWPSQDLQEAIDSWLHMPSSMDVGVSLGRYHTYDYFPDDENTQSMEIRELSSRRRVSSLLRSSFRESLDQVLQSHVERQVHFSSGDWEEESSSPVLTAHDEQQQHFNVDQSLALSNDAIEANQFDPSLAIVTESNPLWNDELLFNGESLLDSTSNQILGTEWEVINELRIDMARLHQRMNNMQSMLEACIEMQIELQRSVRQEVSAALNRSILTRDIAKNDKATTDNESQWENVRKGICCLCGESKINSLLYRCGHMCTCSECAVKLVGDKGKCPMCQAPVVEAVRAYFIQ